MKENYDMNLNEENFYNKKELNKIIENYSLVVFALAVINISFFNIPVLLLLELIMLLHLTLKQGNPEKAFIFLKNNVELFAKLLLLFLAIMFVAMFLETLPLLGKIFAGLFVAFASKILTKDLGISYILACQKAQNFQEKREYFLTYFEENLIEQKKYFLTMLNLSKSTLKLKITNQETAKTVEIIFYLFLIIFLLYSWKHLLILIAALAILYFLAYFMKKIPFN